MFKATLQSNRAILRVFSKVPVFEKIISVDIKRLLKEFSLAVRHIIPLITIPKK